MRAFRTSPPPVAPTAILRPRLLAVLAGRFRAPVTLVLAPAGFGKSTLLAQAVAENALAPAGVDAWVRCAPGDCDPEVLAAAIAAALGARMPAGGGADAIHDAIWSRSPTPVALLVDDAHELDSSPGLDLLVRLAHDLPANGHLVLASRTDLRPRFARHLAADGVAVVVEDDLRLTADERARLAGDGAVAPAELDAADGWPAVTVLLLAAGRAVAERYVWDEVLAGLTADARAELAVVSLLGGGDADVVSAALRRRCDPATSLAAVPLVQRSAGGWVEAHALWRPVLAAHLDADVVPAMRRRAAAALVRQGRLSHAAEVLLDAGVDDDETWAQLGAVFVEACRLWAALLAELPLAAWLARLPPARRNEPEALVLAATEARRSGHALDEAEALLQRAWAAARELGHLEAETSALSQLAHVAWWRDDLATMARLHERLDERARLGAPLGADLAALAQAILADIEGDDAAMLAAVEGATSEVRDTRAAIEWFRARALVGLGRAAEAIAHADAAAATASATFRSAWLSAITSRWYAGDPLGALARHGAQEPPSALLPRDRVLTDLILAGMLAHVGDVGAAERHAAAARAALGALETGRSRAYLHAVEALLALARGDEAAATDRLAEAAAHIAAIGLAQGVRALRPILGTCYLLSPTLRAAIDARSSGPDHVLVCRAVRRLLALRAGDTPTGADVAPLTVEQLVVALPLRCVVEIAARGRDAALGRSLLDRFGARARDLLHDVADRSDHRAANGARDLLRSLPTPPARPVRLGLLGPATLEREPGAPPPADWRRERVRTLLALLVVRRGLTREQVMILLWPDLDAEAASANLRRTLNYVHGVLEPHRRPGDAPWFVRSAHDALRLVADGLVVDAWELERHLDAAAAADRAGTPSVALAELEAALELWRGDFCAELFDDWVLVERDRLRARFVDASVRAGELLLGRHDADRALAIAARAVAAEPWSEAAHRLAIAAHRARGDRAGVRRAYERCELALREIDAEPSAATRMLAAG